MDHFAGLGASDDPKAFDEAFKKVTKPQKQRPK
jgi:hypothetical protein